MAIYVTRIGEEVYRDVLRAWVLQSNMFLCYQLISDVIESNTISIFLQYFSTENNVDISKSDDINNDMLIK